MLQSNLFCRAVLKCGVAALIALVVGAVLLAITAPAYAETSQESLAVQVDLYGFSLDPQPIYQLPHDHRFHRGPTYIHNDYNEWQYFTALGTDEKTGDEISLFICPFHQGWVKAHNGRANLLVFAFSNLNTKEFYCANTLLEGEYTATASNPDSEDFAFTYRISGASGQLTVTYDHPTETWTYQGHSEIKNESNSPYAFDVKYTVKAPGYIPAAYHGLENIGWDSGGPGYRHNPQTMAGLTRYIQVPRADLTGTITVGGREYDVEAEVWYEHQWGNFRNVQTNRYFWGHMRLDDGTAFTWRQYYIDGEWKKYDTGMTRFQVIHPDNTVEYAFGPSFVYTPTKLWTSPRAGRLLPPPLVR